MYVSVFFDGICLDKNVFFEVLELLRVEGVERIVEIGLWDEKTLFRDCLDLGSEESTHTKAYLK